MSFSETIFLFFLALVIFGPKKLPEIARQVGKYLNEFKRASNEFKSQIEQEIAHLEVENKQTILPPSAPVEGTASRTLNSVSAEVSEAPASNEAPAADVPTTLAASVEHPLPAGTNGGPPPVATEAIALSPDVTSEDVTTEDVTTSEVTSTTSQGSHA
ncbi:MAG TPA: twin-arginine translocase TatA/TatE family subunit [Candidatus Dormibacteraeota bacterium]|nr:twin-arginine translocase TatA/TatE family subunit [Candidatus Dormibacteraeota bacterium]